MIQEKKTGYPIPGDEEFQMYGPKKGNRRKVKKKVKTAHTMAGIEELCYILELHVFTCIIAGACSD